MKILYLGAFRFPFHDAAAARVLNNAKAMKECGHKVSFYSWGGEYHDEHLCSDGKYRVEGFEYIITNELISRGSLFTRILTRYMRGRKTISLLNKLEQFPDLIILYNASNRWTKKMIKFCSKHNIMLANDITEWYDNNELNLIDILSNHINMTKTQRLVKNKIVISHFLNDFYPESNNLLVPPLCDPSDSKWRLTIEDDRIKPFEGITLIYAGNPAKKDCLHTVINVVNTLASEGKNVRLIILGITQEMYLEKYSKKLLTKNIHKNVIFLGRISQNLIPAYYKEADFMVLLREPNRKNMAGFPTKFAESMTAVVPVITNATSDLTKYVIDGKTGYIVEDYSYEALIQVMRKYVLTISKADIEKMKIQVKMINSAFDWHHRVAAFEHFFNKMR